MAHLENREKLEANHVQLANYIKENPTEVDFILTIFAAAASGYKWESLLKPFPPMYILNNGEKDVSYLRETINSLPALYSVVEGKSNFSSQQVELVSWIVNSHRTRFCSVEMNQMEYLQQLTGEHICPAAPQYLFKLNYDSHREAAFSENRADRNILYAYHGSNAENFNSILYHGLHCHMNKRSLFGEGTYLSAEPTVAMAFSPWSVTGWPKSRVGNSVSVIALCEVIDDPSVIHSSSKDALTKTGQRVPRGVGGDVPDKYLIVTNNDMVRVKYLLVYGKTTSPYNRCPTVQSRSMQWIHRNSQHLLLLFYISILLFIALMSSNKFWVQVQKFYEQTFDNWGSGDRSPL